MSQDKIIKNSTIAEIGEMSDWTALTLKAMLSDLKEYPKNNGDTYIMLTFCDRTGTIDVPIWDKLEKCREIMKVGSIYEVKGCRKSYDGIAQIKKDTVQLVEEWSDENYQDYVPKYDISDEEFDYIMKDIENMINEIDDKRWVKFLYAILTDAIVVDEEVFSWDTFLTFAPEEYKNLTTAPSASKHHGAKIHGLILHLYGVLKASHKTRQLYAHHPPTDAMNAKEVINWDMLTVGAFTHDIEKVNEYEWKLGIRHKGGTFSHDILMVRRVERVVQKYAILEKEEIDAFVYMILKHHGPWTNYKKDERTQSVEAELLHQYDMIDSRVVGTLA